MPDAFPAATSTAELERGQTLAPRFGPDGLIAAIAADAEDGA
ncbi:MAG: phosphoribosyl-AMP cyclohydrolase, partial [Caulobacteraceae bacterium]|nr:phosphoribosyl-AMP cyclohydrolase [Caulobacteraceae bacterium]